MFQMNKRVISIHLVLTVFRGKIGYSAVITNATKIYKFPVPIVKRLSISTFIVAY